MPCDYTFDPVKIAAATLNKLDQTRTDRAPGAAARTAKLLASIPTPRFASAEAVIRLHDTLLFLRAFPHSTRVAELADKLLNQLEPEVRRLRDQASDSDLFDDERYSGIAGTVVQYEHTYEVARWLAKLYPDKVTALWDVEEQYGKLVNTLPRFLPLIEDDSFVEPDIAFLRLMGTAAGGAGREWLWLMKQFEGAPLCLKDKTELYDSLGLFLDFDLSGSKASRTYARRPTKELYIHDQPLLKRNQISLGEELASPSIPVRKLKCKEAEELLQHSREALLVRHRELYGTTRADPDHVYQADVGRGVQIYVWGLPPDRRLPIRAYHAGCTYKNGVAINYLESISLFDWAEVGFNTFYTYRDGETAWIYAKVLHLLHQLTGVSCISVYPYQIGFENEEAIQSGAFWFYRKLGFRPVKPELRKIAEREEKKIASDSRHRTTAATLRKLANGHLYYEFANAPRGLYDKFTVRNITFAVQKEMADKYEGNSARMKAETSKWLADALSLDRSSLTADENNALSNLALALSLVPNLEDWSSDERQHLIDIVEAKAGKEESVYLRLLQQHVKLKQELACIGSVAPAEITDNSR